MTVYILIKRYIDKDRGLESKTIKQVFADPEQANARLEEKHAKGDFGWFIVAKKVIGDVC